MTNETKTLDGVYSAGRRRYGGLGFVAACFMLMVIACMTIQESVAVIPCGPYYTRQRAPCEAQIAACGAQGILMKWTGKGCRTPDGKVLGDGGCQCDG